MPGKPIKVGPFVGGLNNVSNAGESRDEEVVELVNFELGLDTSLVSRPPLEVVVSSKATSRWRILGVYRVTAANWYVIVQQPDDTGDGSKIHAYANGDFSATPVVIKTVTNTSDIVTGYVQYNEFGYFLMGMGSSISCFRWKESSSATDIATMPKGSVLTSWRDRLWVTGTASGTNGNYVWFSTVDAGGPKPDTWNVSIDFFNVDPGSGGLNTAMLPLTNSLLIFKEDATYRFSFPNSPKQGEIISVSRQVGAAGPNSVAAFENYAFVYDQGRLYELMNTKFTQLNLNVMFDEGLALSVDATAAGVDLSIVGRRLLVRYYTYVFSYLIDSRAWAQWTSFAGTPGKFIELPGDSNSASPTSYLAPRVGDRQLAGANRITDPSFINEDLNGNRTAIEGVGAIDFGNESAALTTSDVTGFYFNLTKSGQNLPDIPVSSGQMYKFSANVTSSITTGFKVKIKFVKYNGTEEVVEQFPTSFPMVIEVPDNSYLMAIQFGIKSSSGILATATLKSPVITLDPVINSPAGVLKLVDGYENTLPKEYIECSVKTKAYDYQANSVFKRLFLWGIDVLTNREIFLQAIPLGKKQQVTWEELEAYTWGQLNQGIWRNPLSWLNISTTITDISGPHAEVSENGRFFVQSPKSLRFRQIQYYVKLTTLGNTDTGPTKLFSITTYTEIKAKVVDKAT